MIPQENELASKYKLSNWEKNTSNKASNAPTEKEIEYWNKVYAPKEDKQIIHTFEEWRIIFLVRLNVLVKKRNPKSEFKFIDKSHQFVFNKLVQYYTNNTEFECETKHQSMRLNKDICLIGSKGVGKTLLMDAFTKNAEFNDDANSLDLPRYGHKKSCSIISNEYESGGSEILIKYKTDKNKHRFDDLGTEAENGNNKHYGNSKNVMQEILQYRYDSGLRQDITSNLRIDFEKPNPMEQIGSLYGNRLEDRFKEMFNFFIIVGDSFRG